MGLVYKPTFLFLKRSSLLLSLFLLFSSETLSNEVNELLKEIEKKELSSALDRSINLMEENENDLSFSLVSAALYLQDQKIGQAIKTLQRGLLSATEIDFSKRDFIKRPKSSAQEILDQGTTLSLEALLSLRFISYIYAYASFKSRRGSSKKRTKAFAKRSLQYFALYQILARSQENEKFLRFSSNAHRSLLKGKLSQNLKFQRSITSQGSLSPVSRLKEETALRSFYEQLIQGPPSLFPSELMALNVQAQTFFYAAKKTTAQKKRVKLEMSAQKYLMVFATALLAKKATSPLFTQREQEGTPNQSSETFDDEDEEEDEEQERSPRTKGWLVQVTYLYWHESLELEDLTNSQTDNLNVISRGPCLGGSYFYQSSRYSFLVGGCALSAVSNVGTAQDASVSFFQQNVSTLGALIKTSGELRLSDQAYLGLEGAFLYRTSDWGSPADRPDVVVSDETLSSGLISLTGSYIWKKYRLTQKIGVGSSLDTTWSFELSYRFKSKTY